MQSGAVHVPNDGAPHASRPFPAEYLRWRPSLDVVTFVPGGPWRQLQPDDDDEYDLFHFAFCWQEQWSRAQHRHFWRVALPYWPTKRGKRQTVIHLSLWVWAFRRKGYSDTNIATRLHYRLDTLQRDGALRLADEFAAYWDAHYKDEYRETPLPCDPPIVWPAASDKGQPPLDGPFCEVAWNVLKPKDLELREQVRAQGIRAANHGSNYGSNTPRFEDEIDPEALDFYRRSPPWVQTTLDSYRES